MLIFPLKNRCISFFPLLSLSIVHCKWITKYVCDTIALIKVLFEFYLNTMGNKFCILKLKDAGESEKKKNHNKILKQTRKMNFKYSLILLSLIFLLLNGHEINKDNTHEEHYEEDAEGM